MLHIVDDEDVIRDALEWLAQSRGLPARGHAGGQAFRRHLGKIELAQGRLQMADLFELGAALGAALQVQVDGPHPGGVELRVE